MHTYGRLIHRRDFLRTTGAGLVVLPYVGLPRFLRFGSEKARVALVRTSDRKRGVGQALALLDLSGVSGRRVLLKPNFNTAGDTPGSTHNDTLSQLVYELRERGAREITLGESSGPPDTRGVMEQKGIFDLASDLAFGVVNYEEIPEADWVHFGPNGTHWPEGFWLPRHVVDAEYNVSTCCLKTHGFGGVFTMSLKLSVGLTPKNIRRPLHRSPDMRRMIAELNTGYQPQLIVLDGVVAFTDGGPSQGELKQANVIVAGYDRVAIDAVGLAVLKELGSNDAIMGHKIFEQEQMARAVELGLGIASADQIEFITPDEASRAYAERLEGILALG
jgi:uncharacterized protein (DUF362 family)